MKDKSIRRPACINAMSWEGILEEFKEFDYKLSEDLRSLSYVLNDSILEDFRRFLSDSEVRLHLLEPLDKYLSEVILSKPCSWEYFKAAIGRCTDDETYSELKEACYTYSSAIEEAAPVVDSVQQGGAAESTIKQSQNRHTFLPPPSAALPAQGQGRSITVNSEGGL